MTARLPGDLAYVRQRPILIVDAARTARARIAASLDRLGLLNPQIEAVDDDAARAELTRRVRLGPQHRPALVILDRQRPDGADRDLLSWIRSLDALRDLPVVVLTAQDAVQDVTDAYDLDVLSYLVKPVGFDALCSIVRELSLPWLLL